MRRVVLALAGSLLAACSGADFGQFSGAQKDDTDPPEESDTGDDDSADNDDDDGTDVPTWINGAYLTCDWQDVPSETEVMIRCGVYSLDGDDELPSNLDLTVDWKILDENGKPVDLSKILKSADGGFHIVSLQVPIETFAKWTISAAFSAGGSKREIGKKIKETLGGDNEALKACFALQSETTSCFFKNLNKDGESGWSSGNSAATGAEAVVDPEVLAKAHKIFVTSDKFTGNLGGRAGADGICQGHATAAGMTGTWKAILATEGMSIQASLILTQAIVNLRPADLGGPQLVAKSIDAISAFGALENAVRYDEYGKGIAGESKYVWTGAKGNGESLNGKTCNNWTQTSGSARQGAGGRSSAQWLNLLDATCDLQASIYCIDGQ